MKTLINLIGIILFFAFFVSMMLLWASGCGESYTDSKGITHTEECKL